MQGVFDHMVGQSAGIRAVFETIDKLAPTDLTVLILGETGTGKELVARSLHRRSSRRRAPFVPLNCAALPATLLESELFGFERGSFTGAVGAHVGHIERADKGTLFLDEIAEMPLGAQSKLLRVLQDHRVTRLGSSRDKKVDVRVLAATHQDLDALVTAGAFRVDLFHRLNEVQLALPPLRDRNGDVEQIAEFVLERLSKEQGRTLRLTPAAQAALRAHEWPGNVRELENCLTRATAATAGETIDAPDLQLEPTAQEPRRLREIVDRATERALRTSLRRHGCCAQAAAAELEVSIDELRGLAERFGIPLA
jgi:transcriptional regulator with GAF, ATPase, and Fis domain